VAVLGQTVVANLFGRSDPLGETIRIQRVPFTVIGVLAEKGLDLAGADQDDQVLVPVTTALRRLFNLTYLNAIYVEARDEETMPEVVSDATDLLRERHRLRETVASDFTVQNQAELVRTQQEVTSTFTTLLGSIAAVSLLVGGIGILAVMLITVKERTREIGIRRAVGARQRDILLQFLVEALVLSLTGGFVGVAMGAVASRVTGALTHWPVVVAFPTVLLSFSLSAAIGLFFGVYPARKAARLQPIDALRSG
jgi:putative ABC transport system permease protein